ncbi:MAG: hypothetical protein ACFFA5_00645 [Promethearchaeota archaeon]
MKWKYISAIEISGILFVVWLTLLLMLLFIDVYIVPLQLPLIGYVGRVITGITKVAIGCGLFITWLFIWNKAVQKYFQNSIRTSKASAEK